MNVTAASVDASAYRAHGSAVLSRPLPSSSLHPLRAAAEALAPHPPHRARLSGVHNPFGRASALLDPWKFLDVCESAVLLDAVEALLGPDLILWDSELYLDARMWDAARRHEGRYWPVDPLAGLIADIALASGQCTLEDVHRAARFPVAAAGAHYVIRYMPASSHYNRDPDYAANRLATEEHPLVNYQNRSLWLVRGVDRAANDFATGFAPAAPAWAGAFHETEV